MIALLGTVGWGLLACGALTHAWHRERLRELLSLHLDRSSAAAAGILTAEIGLAVATAGLFLTASSALSWVAMLCGVFAIGFVAWIARLLASNSDLPCACSFSAAPTTWWSLGRAACVLLVILLAVSSAGDIDVADRVATLLVGWAIASGLFVLPEALSWPSASRALLARVEAHTP